MLTQDEMKTWQRSIWSDLRRASTREGHAAPYPVELAGRLIRPFSFAGHTVLDPFAGTGSTAQAAIGTGRNSIANYIEPANVEIPQRRVADVAGQTRLFGATDAEVLVDENRAARRIPLADRIPAAV
jgi:site-specific DNA-methyltransferase (adenine-specific)